MSISSFNPSTGESIGAVAEATSSEALKVATATAATAAHGLKKMGRLGRAELLRAMAQELEASRPEIVAIAHRETALGEARLDGEFTRTCYQLRLFATVLEEGSYLEATLDSESGTEMGPRPDLRRILMPLGPVAVFGASNFPLAFSVPGGDTAAALAAGCPVLIKAHGAHPETSTATFECLHRAAESVGAPEGTLALIFGREAGAALVQDLHVKAVGFTGSEAGGRALFDLANARRDPIPFYGELGSINPVVVSPRAARSRGAAIAAGYVASVNASAGQLCTKPGLVFVAESEASEFRAALSESMTGKDNVWLLTEGIRQSYDGGVAKLAQHPGMEIIGGATVSDAPGYATNPALFWTRADTLGDGINLVYEECFGPCGVVVTYRDEAQLQTLLEECPGSLTATVHAEADEESFVENVFGLLIERAGRVIWNGYPTGVNVGWAMTHGGPYPSSTAPLHTSVGATSIRRFLRPVTFQSVPPQFLPDDLHGDGLAAIPHRIDGEMRLP